MAKLFDSITDELQKFIAKQKLFFVATAPLSPTGHVNLSPKGLDSFCILSPQQVAYLDLTGSGNETSAHLLENGRITIMFCAFQEPPLILRLYGQGYTVLPNSPDWDHLYCKFTPMAGVRQIIVVNIETAKTSCGFGVPLYEYKEQRPTLINWAAKKGEQGIIEYQQKNNLESVDGLPTALKLQ